MERVGKTDHRNYFHLALAACCVAMVCGCTQTSEAREQIVGEEVVTDADLMGSQSAEDEYYVASEQLQLPDGYEYPEPASILAAEGGTSFERGYGETAAFSYYVCAWESEYIRSVEQSPKQAATALELIKDLPAHRIYQESYDLESFLPAHNEMVAAAELGDPSKIQEDLDLNCNVEVPSE